MRYSVPSQYRPSQDNFIGKYVRLLGFFALPPDLNNETGRLTAC